jgi:type VI secretion system protein ImpE
MTSHEAFAAGRLTEAVERQESIVAERPGEVSPRVVLIELLLFTGRLDDVRSHLAIISSDDPAWPATARTFRQLIRAERLRSHRVRRPLILPEPPAAHAKARWLAIRNLRDGDPTRAVRWIDKADERSPALRGFLDGREFAELRDADDRFASVLEAFVDGRYVWFPWEAVSRVKLEPAKFALDRFARYASVRLRDGVEFQAYLPLLYPGSHEEEGEFAVGLETDHICPDGGPVRCIGGKELIVDDVEIPLGDVTMIELR